MVNVLGWIVAGRRERAAAARLRAEKQTDVSTALLAEILHYRDALQFFDLDERWEKVVEQMETDESYVPFIPSERNDTIFRAIISEIHVLPVGVIRPVTRYYNQIFAIDAIIADLRSDDYAQAAPQKRIALYTDYISLKKQAIEDGERAIAALERHLSVAGAGAPLTEDGAR